MPKLTARKVETLKIAGLHGDGGGLYLSVKSSGAKSWILRTVVHGRRRDLGLGSASLVTLAEAREKARTLRKVAREGGDPDGRVSPMPSDPFTSVGREFVPSAIIISPRPATPPDAAGPAITALLRNDGLVSPRSNEAHSAPSVTR